MSVPEQNCAATGSGSEASRRATAHGHAAGSAAPAPPTTAPAGDVPEARASIRNAQMASSRPVTARMYRGNRHVAPARTTGMHDPDGSGSGLDRAPSLQARLDRRLELIGPPE